MLYGFRRTGLNTATPLRCFCDTKAGKYVECVIE